METYTTLSVTTEVAAEIRERREAAGADVNTSEVLEELLRQDAER
jgi:hypothetical protein